MRIMRCWSCDAACGFGTSPCSINVTAWPRRKAARATDSPTMPAPTMRMRAMMVSPLERHAQAQRVVDGGVDVAAGHRGADAVQLERPADRRGGQLRAAGGQGVDLPPPAIGRLCPQRVGEILDPNPARPADRLPGR